VSQVAPSSVAEFMKLDLADVFGTNNVEFCQKILQAGSGLLKKWRSIRNGSVFAPPSGKSAGELPRHNSAPIS